MKNQFLKDLIKFTSKAFCITITGISLLTAFSACDAALNEDVLYGSVGNYLEKDAPGKVSQLKASIGATHVSLEWVNPADKDLYGIQISYFSEDGKYTDQISLTGGTPAAVPIKYTFYDLKTDVQYTFAVSSFDKNLNYSDPIQIPAKTASSTTQYEVKNANAYPGDKFVTLSWENQDFADLLGIQISIYPKDENIQSPVTFILNDPINDDKSLLPTTYTFHNLRNNARYTFDIVELDIERNLSKTKSLSATPTENTNNIEVKDKKVKVEEGDSEITLSWENPTDENFYGIVISAEPAEGSLATPVYFIKSENDIPEKYTAINLANDVTYRFHVQTLDRDLYKSNGVFPNGTPKKGKIDPVKLPTVVRGDKFITLNWENPATENLYGIKILISDKNDPSFSKQFSLLKDGDSPLPTTLNIPELINDHIYVFKIYAIDNNLNISTEQTVEGIPEKSKNNIVVSDFKAYGGDNIVNLEWKNPTEKAFKGLKLVQTPAEGALADPLYFFKSEDSDIPAAFTVTGLRNGVTYEYQLFTIDSNNYVSEISKSAPALTAANSVPSISALAANSEDEAVTLKWTNPSLSYIYGIKILYYTITRTPSDSEDEGENSDSEAINENIVKSDFKQVSFIKDSSMTLPNTYTISGLSNDKEYGFDVFTFDQAMNYSELPGSVTATPTKTQNNFNVSNLTQTYGDKTVLLQWNNPSNTSLYGIKIEATPAEGSLSVPVYFLNSDRSKIPTSYTAVDLTNETLYEFKVYTIDKNMMVSSGNMVSCTPKAAVNNENVEDMSALVYSQKIMLTWKNPENTSALTSYELTISPSDSGAITINRVNGEFPETYTIENLTNDIPYSFTLRTVDTAGNKSDGRYITATPNTGSAGISANSDLIPYKAYFDTVKKEWNHHIAYDFGYQTEKSEKTFTFVSTSALDLTQTRISAVLGNSSSYEVSYSPSAVANNENFSITVSYTPSAYDKADKSSASWDEADIIIGGVEDNSFRVIGSNFPQPKNINKSLKDGTLKLWLRADMISANNLDSDNGFVKLLPDYIPNSGHGAASTASSKRASFSAADSDFNGLPAIDFTSCTNAQLVSAGTSENPLVNSTDGITAFVVFRYTDQASYGTVISANNGTRFPVLYASKRTYDTATGVYNANSYGYALAVRGNGNALNQTARYACISDSLTDDDNRLLPLYEQTSGGTSTHGIWGNALSACMRYSGPTGDSFSQTSSKKIINVSSPENYSMYPKNVREWIEANKDKIKDNSNNITIYPSNLRFWLNGDERFLGWNYQQSSPYKTTVDALFNNDRSTYGMFGKPEGNGIGYRFGSLSQMKVPDSTSKTNYDKFLAGETYNETSANLYKTWLDEILKVRKYDYAYSANSSYSGGAANSTGNYSANWMVNDLWYTGKIENICIGPDFNVATTFKGKIAEVFIFDYALSEAEIEDMNNYINYRYNLTEISSTPSDYDF